MVSLLGLAVAHLAGALLRAMLTGAPLRQAVKSPSSAWFGLAVAYALSLGWAGVLVLATLVAASLALRHREAGGTVPWLAVAGLAVFVLARPWVPTQWDEFVWLGKARLESLGFGGVVAAALDPSQHLIPPGYPPLFPAAVGWLSLGQDSVNAHVLAASGLLVLSAASALEAWTEHLRRPSALALAVFATPLVWVHLRSTYVDLPVGLLGVALLGQLLRGGPAAVPLAVVLVAFKDEGLGHVLAASASAVLITRSWRLTLPAVAGLVTAFTWRWLAHQHGVENSDHALGAPLFGWTSTLVKLAVLHATDVFTWGVFWAVALGCALPEKSPTVAARALKVLVGLDLLIIAAALLAGPERVRVFAENGTLINRLLLQVWPAAALLIITRTTPTPAATPLEQR